MKTPSKILFCTTACMVILSLGARAALTIDIIAGRLLNSSGNEVSDSSIWALVVDDDNNNTLPGNLSLSSTGKLLPDQPTFEAVWEDFSGIEIVADAMINGDRILEVFLVDGFNTSGQTAVTYQTITLSDAQWQAVSGKKWGIFWFPELIGSTTLPSSGNFEIGGYYDPNVGSGGHSGMVMPTYVDGTNPQVVAAFIGTDVPGAGGALGTSNFTAIPEPSAMLLTLLGSVALLRRRRA